MLESSSPDSRSHDLLLRELRSRGGDDLDIIICCRPRLGQPAGFGPTFITTFIGMCDFIV